MNRYYGSAIVRELCHGVKEHDRMAIEEMAEYFLSLETVTEHSVIIPAPQHSGYADYTREIADIVASATGARVLDVLRCMPHEPLYEQKKQERLTVPRIYLTGQVQGSDLYFLDNVIDTGTTFRTTNRLFNGRLKPLVYART